MSSKWLQPGAYDDTAPAALNDGITTFVQGRAPFNSESISRLVTLYRSMMRMNALLMREISNLTLTMELPVVKDALPLDAAVQIRMLAATFEIVSEESEMSRACVRFMVDHDIGALAQTCGEIASQIVLMARVTHYALRGMVVDVDATVDAHDVVETSAQRIKHLTDELLSILPNGVH